MAYKTIKKINSRLDYFFRKNAIWHHVLGGSYATHWFSRILIMCALRGILILKKKLKKKFFKLLRINVFDFAKWRNTDYFCLKIPLYHRMFSKTLRPNFFTPSQVFMYLKATRPKFFQDSTIDKVHVLYITLHIISNMYFNMYFKGIKSVTSIHR